MRARRLLFITALTACLCFASVPSAHAAIATTGDVDRTFGTNGLVRTPFGSPSNAYADDVVLQSTGKIVAGGYSSGADYVFTTALARYSSNGVLDTTFDVDGKVSGPEGLIHDLAVGPSDALFAAVDRFCDTCRALNAAKFTADGALVSEFGTDGVASVPFDAAVYERVLTQGIAAFADGSVIVVGLLADTNWNDTLVAARFDANGDLDTSFATNGIYTAADVDAEAVAVDADGKILIAGTQTHSCAEFSCSYSFNVRRLTSAGALDTAFGASGVRQVSIGSQSFVSDLVLQPDGKIVLGGATSPTTAPERIATARLTSAGALDSTYSADGIADFADPSGGSAYAAAVTLTPDGKIVFSGSDTSHGGHFKLIRVTSTGALDKVFGTNGWIRTDTGDEFTAAHSVVAQPDGRIVAAGYGSTCFPCTYDFALARYGSPLPQTAGTYAWRNVSTSSAYGSSYRLERLKGASLSFSFTGTSVTWYTMKSPSQGKAAVYIDGTKINTYNNYASSTAYKVGRTFSGLSAGAHTIKIVATGEKGSTSGTGTNVVVDAFKVGSTLHSTPTASYTWQSVSHASALGGSYARTDLVGSSVTLSFTGTGITWSTIRGTTMGKARVYLDGADKGVVDNYRSSTEFGYARTYQALTAGTHTLKIVVLGQKNASATDEMIAIDRFMVY